MPPSTSDKDKNLSDNPKSASNTNLGNRPTTRTETRCTRGNPIPEEQQDIKDATEGRKYLEKHLLLCPLGEPPSHTSLATCLYQVSAMAGIQKPILNAIRSIAFLLEELEETHINITVKEAFDSQITEFTSDMKLLIEDARKKINEHIRTSEDRLFQAMKNIPTQTKQSQSSQSTTYASTLVNSPPHANPKIAAQEGVKARQFLLEDISKTKFSQLDTLKLKAELNKILDEMDLKTRRICAVSKL